MAPRTEAKTETLKDVVKGLNKRVLEDMKDALKPKVETKKALEEIAAEVNPDQSADQAPEANVDQAAIDRMLKLPQKDFDKRMAKLEKTGKFADSLAWAYKHSPELAKRFMQYVDQKNERLALKASTKPDEDSPGELYVDGGLLKDLKDELRDRSRKEIVAKMNEGQLQNVVSSTEDGNLRQLANQRMAQLKLDRMSENMA